MATGPSRCPRSPSQPQARRLRRSMKARSLAACSILTSKGGPFWTPMPIDSLSPAFLAPSAPMLESTSKTDLSSTASISGSSMISTLSSARSASKPHNNGAKREQNPHYRHYNGLTGACAVEACWVHAGVSYQPLRRVVDDDPRSLSAIRTASYTRMRRGHHGGAAAPAHPDGGCALAIPANISLLLLPPIRRNSTRKKISGMKFDRRSSKTMPSNPSLREPLKLFYLDDRRATTIMAC